MCDLCSGSEEEKEKARERCRRIAIELRSLACGYDCLAGGNMAPHGDTAKLQRLLALRMVKELVEEWI